MENNNLLKMNLVARKITNAISEQRGTSCTGVLCCECPFGTMVSMGWFQGEEVMIKACEVLGNVGRKLKDEM